MFDINPSAPAPIWMQIEEGLRRLIQLGTLKPGDAVPSVRDLARALRVNPNTVARVYQRLSEAGVLAVRRGEGTFVADQPVPLKRAERNETLRDATTRLAGVAMSVGASLEETTSELESAWTRVVRASRRKA